VRCAKDRWRNQFVFLPDTEEGWGNCRPLHDSLTGGRHVQCCCFDSTSFVRRLSRRQFQCRQIVLDSVGGTVKAEHPRDSLNFSCPHGFLPLLPMCYLSLQRRKVVGKYLILSEGEVVHPRHNLPYHWHTPSFVLGWRHSSEGKNIRARECLIDCLIPRLTKLPRTKLCDEMIHMMQSDRK